VLGTLLLLAGALLIAGFLTPVSGGIVGVLTGAAAFSKFPVPSPNLFDAPLPIVLVIIIAAAVVALGPGSMSLDARLFGRREIHIPASRTETEL